MTLGKLFKSNYLYLSFILVFFSCKTDSKVKINGYTMGTSYEVTINNFKDNPLDVKKFIDELLVEINDTFSTYIIDSEISKINKSKTNENIKVSERFQKVLNTALGYCTLSNGSYDVTISPIVELWGFGKNKTQVVPLKSNIEEVLINVGYENIYLKDKILRKNITSLNIDLNSIAKGYAVDQVSLFLKHYGYDDFLVEIGGELKSSSTNLSSWVVGIAHPLSNSVIKKINLNNYSMATSGTYNNYFIDNETMYSHMLNPKTGYPFAYEMISATVISKDCIDADALATVAFTMNVDSFLDIINSMDNTDCFLITIDENKNLLFYESEDFSNFIH